MCRMPKTLLAVVAAGLLTGCNSYNRPTTQIGYWPDYEEQKSLNDSVLNSRDTGNTVVTNNAPVPGAGQSTFIAPVPAAQPVQLVAPVPAPAPAPATVFVTPGPEVQPAPGPAVTLPPPAIAIVPAPAPARGGTYIVKRGDSLWLIAKNQYGNALRWKEIAAANPTINPKRLQVGQRLTLPNIASNTPIAGAAAAARPAKSGIEDQAAFK